MVKSIEFLCLPRSRKCLGDIDDKGVGLSVACRTTSVDCQEVDVGPVIDEAHKILNDSSMIALPFEIIHESTSNRILAIPEILASEPIGLVTGEKDDYLFNKLRRAVQAAESVDIPGWGQQTR